MKHWQHAITTTVLALTLLACADSAPEQAPLALVTDADLAELSKSAPEPGAAALDSLSMAAPVDARAYNNQASLSGPEIKILAPKLDTAISNPMMVHVEFASREPGANINMDSFKLTYKKLWGIDLTDRVQDYIQGASIKAPEVELPEGRHTLEIYIEDSAANVSTRLITVEVASN